MADTNVNEELNLDQKVTVKNIAGWSVGFARIDGIGDVTITAEGSTRLSRNEIISQVQNGNRLFTGTDGNGSHATLYIDDAPTRKEIGFDSEDGKDKQVVFNDAAITKVFAIFPPKVCREIECLASQNGWDGCHWDHPLLVEMDDAALRECEELHNPSHCW